MIDTAVAAVASPFSIGQVVSRTFSVLGRHFLLFFGLAVLAILPSEFMAFVMQPGAGGLPFFGAAYWATFILSMLVSVIMSVLLSAVLTYGTVMDLSGRQASFGEALGVAVRLFFPLIGLAIISSFGVGFAFLLLIVPGLMLMTAWIVAVPVRVIEGTEVFDTFSRSAELTRGHRWSIFGLLVVYFIVAIVVSLIARPLLVGVSAAHIGGIAPLYFIVDGVIRTFTTVISATGVACLYYELRSSKEGIGPDQLASVFE